LKVIENHLELDDDSLLQKLLYSASPSLRSFVTFYSNLPNSLVELYSEVWTVWLKYLRDPTTSWALNQHAAPCLIMGNFSQLLELKEKGDKVCITFANNASRKSFTDGRLPENCLAAQRVKLRNGYTRLDTALCLLASNSYFYRKPQIEWFSSFMKVGESAGFQYNNNMLHCDIHGIAYCVEFGRLNHASKKEIEAACAEAGRESSDFAGLKKVLSQIKHNLKGTIYGIFEKLMNIFQPSHTIVSWGENILWSILSQTQVVEGPSTLMSRLKYKSVGADDLLLQHPVHFIKSPQSKSLVALVPKTDIQINQIPQDVQSTLYNFKMCVLHFSWGYCFLLMDAQLLASPFNATCDIGKSLLGKIWREQIVQLLNGPLLASSPAKPTNLKQVFPLPPKIAIVKRKRTRRGRKHVAKMVVKNMPVYTTSSKRGRKHHIILSPNDVNCSTIQ